MDLVLTNDKDIVAQLGAAALLQRLEVRALFVQETNVERFLGRVAASPHEPQLLVFSIDRRRYLDTVDWVSTHWEELSTQRSAVLAAQVKDGEAQEVVVFTNSHQPKVEHIARDNVLKTLEVLLTIQYSFLLDEFGEHDYPGLNDMVISEGVKYNVQTQYYPGSDARISTEIYRDGQLVKSFTHVVDAGRGEHRKLRFLIEDMHTRVLASVTTLGQREQ
jgi:hypothetical protein